VITAALLTAGVLAGSGHRRAAALAAGVWLAGTAEFAADRIAPGPRRPSEITTMLLTSIVIPPTAVANWLVGRIAHPRRRTRRWHEA
jgi:hypothetical protein